MNKFTKLDLSKYEKMYDNFDDGHNRKHCIAVRKMSVSLAKKYAPNKIEIIYIAATLHDIGLSVDRENHEAEGKKLICQDKYLLENLSKEDFKDICHIVKEHRASTGQPQTILAKIISDADRTGGYCSPKKALFRAYSYGLKKHPEFTFDQQIERAAQHLTEKFSEDSYGARVYFEETKDRLKKSYGPIINAYKKQDFKYLKSLIKTLVK